MRMACSVVVMSGERVREWGRRWGMENIGFCSRSLFFLRVVFKLKKADCWNGWVGVVGGCCWWFER